MIMVSQELKGIEVRAPNINFYPRFGLCPVEALYERYSDDSCSIIDGDEKRRVLCVCASFVVNLPTGQVHLLFHMHLLGIGVNFHTASFIPCESIIRYFRVCFRLSRFISSRL